MSDLVFAFGEPSLERPGKRVFIRTVTTYYVGEITDVTDYTLTLKNVSWVGDTGRFSAAQHSGVFKEVEPYPGPCTVFRAAIVDICGWEHELPPTQNRPLAKGIIPAFHTIVVPGQKIFCRTVTTYYVGEVSAYGDAAERSGGWIALVKASWVADTGRFSTCLKTGEFKEVEPYPYGVVVKQQALVDICTWEHELPTKAK